MPIWCQRNATFPSMIKIRQAYLHSLNTHPCMSSSHTAIASPSFLLSLLFHSFPLLSLPPLLLFWSFISLPGCSPSFSSLSVFPLSPDYYHLLETGIAKYSHTHTLIHTQHLKQKVLICDECTLSILLMCGKTLCTVTVIFCWVCCWCMTDIHNCHDILSYPFELILYMNCSPQKFQYT